MISALLFPDDKREFDQGEQAEGYAGAGQDGWDLPGVLTGFSDRRPDAFSEPAAEDDGRAEERGCGGRRSGFEEFLHGEDDRRGVAGADLDGVDDLGENDLGELVWRNQGEELGDGRDGHSADEAMGPRGEAQL